MFKQKDLLAIIVLAMCALYLGRGGVELGPATQLLAVPLVLFAPGYALLAAMALDHIGAAERLLLSLSGSIAVTILGSILLHPTPWGLRPASWSLMLGVFTLAAALVGLGRRQKLQKMSVPFRLGLSQGLLIGASGVVLVAALTLASTPLPAPQASGYSMFWLLPASPDNQSFQLGVRSEEFITTGYRIQLELDGTTFQEWLLVALEPGQKWEQTIQLPPGRAATPALEARLYRLDAPDIIYRRVAIGIGP